MQWKDSCAIKGLLCSQLLMLNLQLAKGPGNYAIGLLYYLFIGGYFHWGYCTEKAKVMAEAILSVVAEGIISKVISVAAEEISLAWGFKGELRSLQGKLEMLQKFIIDAERRQAGEQAVQLWVKKLKGVAYEADDVLDEFAYEILRRKVEIRNQMKRKVRNFFSSSNPIDFRCKMAHKIKKINESLSKINNEAAQFGLQQQIYTSSNIILPSSSRDSRETHSFLPESEAVVGRGDDVSNIVKMLVSPDNQQVLSVLPIVGMGGSGKTFLAKLVYNHNQVEEHFNERLWVCVSVDFDVNRILRKILESLTKNSCALEGKDVILKSLKKELEGKKYLLVLDDVWSEDLSLWEDLRDCLSSTGTSTGNGVLVTTRSRRVASNMGTLPRHDLEKLSHEDCWTIFEKIAFSAGGPSRTPPLEAIGQQIIKKCAGLPLAAKVLGGMMHSRMDMSEWISIQNSEIWNLPEDENGILRELKLSFVHLRYPTLKECFTYCSIFPKDFKFEKDDLIQLWMAQGLLHPTQRNDEMEDVGNFYLSILLSNSLFQDVEKDDYDNIKFFKMHDLVHDLALSVSKYDCLTLKDDNMGDISEVRHLSVILNEDRMPKNIEESTQKLRTLFSRSNFFFNATKIKCLWALNLEESGIEELPISIGKMIHLRYLNVSGTQIKALPDAITKLYNLETLRLLRCRNLEKLPKEFQKLVRLRHLYMEDHPSHRRLMPSGIGNLTCLQTLPFFVIRQEKGHRIEELGPIGKLKGELKIYGLEHVKSKEEAKGAELLKKSKIQKLKLNWTTDGKRKDGINNDNEVLEGLKPPGHLKGLEIENFGGGKFASWMMMSDGMLLQSLVKIELKNCKRCRHIPTLGHLPCLKQVVFKGLDNVRRVGNEFYGVSRSNGAKVFPELISLYLGNMPNLKEWDEASSSSSSLSLDLFPCLEKLTISSCPQLITFPGHFPFLKRLHIRECKMVAMEKMSSKVTSLTFLRMINVSGVSRVDGILQQLLENNSGSLRRLDIKDCGELLNLPGIPLTSVNESSVVDCPNVTDVVVDHITEETETELCSSNRGLTSLQSLWIHGCNKLARFPKGFLGTLASLEWLGIQLCPTLIVNPHHYDEVRCLTSLRGLSIFGCTRLVTAWQQGLFCPLTGQLQNLVIGQFSEELEYFPWPEASDVATATATATAAAAREYQYPFVSLKSLTLKGEGMTKITSLPHQLQHLTALTYLEICEFQGLETLPEWLRNLSSLRKLRLWSCDKLSNLPSSKAMQRLTNLRWLVICRCPLLKERCTKGSGPEWQKISHIPHIDIQ